MSRANAGCLLGCAVLLSTAVGCAPAARTDYARHLATRVAPVDQPDQAISAAFTLRVRNDKGSPGLPDEPLFR